MPKHADTTQYLVYGAAKNKLKIIPSGAIRRQERLSEFHFSNQVSWPVEELNSSLAASYCANPKCSRLSHIYLRAEEREK